MLKLSAGSSNQTVLPFAGLNHPSAVAVDTAGNLYVTDRVEPPGAETAAGSSNRPVLPFDGLNDPGDVAADTAGNLYVERNQRGAEPTGRRSSDQEGLPFTGVSQFRGVAVDSAGNLYLVVFISEYRRGPTASSVCWSCQAQ